MVSPEESIFGRKKCANDTEFNTWVKTVTMQQIIISAYFDINDYQSSIKYFMEDSWISLRPESCVVTTNFFKKNLLELDDNIFGLFNTKTKDFFYQVSKNR
jgi:hypothetical protein